MTERLYRCHWCGFENIVRASAHRPRLCPRTNCGGRQESVDEAEATDARLTPVVVGKAIGSAT